MTSIKQIASRLILADTDMLIEAVTGFGNVDDYHGQGGLKYTQPLSTREIYELPEFVKALAFAKLLAKSKKALNEILKSIPLATRGEVLKLLQYEMQKHSFIYPSVDIKIASVSSTPSPEVAELLAEFKLACSRKSTIASQLSAFDGARKVQVMSGITKYLKG